MMGRYKAASALTLMLIVFGCARSPEARRDRHLERGQKLLAEKDHARAILEFRSAVQAMPKDAEPVYHLGLAFRAAGDLVSAVSAFRKTVELNPAHVGAQLKLAELMSFTGDPTLLKEAKSRLEALMSTSPIDAEMLSVLAITELKLGNTEDAIENLEQALARAPQQLSSSITLAMAKLSQEDVRGAEEVLKKACENAPGSSEPHQVLGRFYHSQKRVAEAEAEFRRALQINPKSGPALMDLARLQMLTSRKAEAEENFKRLANLGEKTYKSVYALFLHQQGRLEDAVREFERLAKEDPNDRAARTQLISAYLAVNRTADVEKILADVLKRNPKDLDALLQQAGHFLRVGKHAQAEENLNLVLRLKPDSAEVRYSLAKLHQARGSALTYRQQLSEAVALNPFLLPARLELAQALVSANSGKAALDVLNETPESQKSLLPVLVQRNWALWALGEFEQMRKGIDQGLSRERSTDLLIQDGLLKLRAGNFAGGRGSLEEALKINPSDLRALAALRDAYVVEKKPSLALLKVKEYAAQQPKSAPIQQFLGTLLLAGGERGQARVAFTAAKAADPQFVPADLSLVQLSVLDRGWDEARSTLRRILAANEGHTLARLWLGNLEQLTGNHRAAMEHFQKVVEAVPDHAQALNNLAYLLAEHTSRTDDALKYAEKAREHSPDDPDIADTLGWICYRKGLYAMAVRHLEEAVSKSENAVCKYHLAMAYFQTGDAKRGKSVLQAARRANPNLPEAIEAAKFDQAK